MNPVRVELRSYFSSYLLHEARILSDLAGQIEAAHSGRSRFDDDHRGHVLASVLCSAGFMEATINELFQDALDGHGVDADGYIAPLDQATRDRMAEFWRATDGGTKYSSLRKYQMALLLADRKRFDEGAQPFQDALLVVILRNAIAHYSPRSLAADTLTDMTKRLRGKFADNVLMADSGNPWWPDHCLGQGLAEWAWRSAVALTDRFSEELGLEPNYRRGGILT